MLGIVLAAARISIGGVLVLAAIAQRRSGFDRRLQAIEGYRLVPRRMQPLILGLVTGAEMFLGPCPITGVHPRAINLITACYLLILAGAMAQALRRGIVTECGCFGALSAERVRWRLVTRSIILSAFLAADALLGARWALASGHETAVLVPLTILTLGQFLFDVESARRHLAGNRASLP